MLLLRRVFSGSGLLTSAKGSNLRKAIGWQNIAIFYSVCSLEGGHKEGILYLQFLHPIKSQPEVWETAHLPLFRKKAHKYKNKLTWSNVSLDSLLLIPNDAHPFA